MEYYFIVQIRINNPNDYKKYIEKADEVFNKFNGEYLAVDDHPELIEGNWNYTRLVLIKFKCREDFKAWYNSEEYKNILKYRLASADCDTILVEGKK